MRLAGAGFAPGGMREADLVERERRGYRRTGERPRPIAPEPPLAMTVLAREMEP